jgi:hypothetical protein
MKKQTVLASSPTKEGIINLINKYWYSKNYTVNFDTGEVIGLKGIMQGFRVREKKGRYQFVREDQK